MAEVAKVEVQGGRIPGPKAKAIIDLDNQYTSTSYMRDYPLVVDRAEGCYIRDPDGNRFLDFNAGIAVITTGHCHPKVVEAIKAQAEKFHHYCSTDFYYEPMALLAQRLAESAPGDSKKRVFLTNSGAEAIDGAIKLSRYSTKRSKIISFLGAFHGRTYGAMSLTNSKPVQKKGFGPFVPDVISIPYPYCFRCSYKLRPGDCDLYCIRYLEEVVFDRMCYPDEVAAVFIEPIMGEGGYVIPPDGFHQRLRRLTADSGILFVADEVQSGMGRTGKMWAIEHWGVEPDVICCAKGLASGLPIGAIISKADVMNWARGSHGTTFGGNPVACAAALATLDLVEGGLMERAAAMGARLMEGLKALQKKHPSIGDIRGIGLMIGVEFVKPDGSPAADIRNEVLGRAFGKGVILLGCGASVIRLAPPLVVDEPEIQMLLRVLDECLGEVGA